MFKVSVKPDNLPAIHGGRPIRNIFLPFSQPKLSDAEVNAVLETLQSGWLTTAGKAKEFENALSAFVGTKYAVALNSCTAGLFLSLKALGIGPGDEVVTTPMTFVATVNVIEHTGATPILVDIDPETWCIDPSRIEAALTPATKAIMPVHYQGMPCDMGAIRSISQDHGIPVIQDCAHAIETEWDGANVGGYGDFACYSFYATKNVTTGEGGMVAANDEHLADRIRILALHGLDKNAYNRYSSGGSPHYDVFEPGYKYNMPDIAAALGIEGLKLIRTRSARRKAIWDKYKAELKDLPGLRLPPEPPPNATHAMHLFVCSLDPNRSGLDRDTMIRNLKAENIGTGIHYVPVHHFTYYRKKYGYSDDALPVASKLGGQVFSLPLTPYLSDEDVDDVIRAVRRIILYYANSNINKNSI